MMINSATAIHDFIPPPSLADNPGLRMPASPGSTVGMTQKTGTETIKPEQIQDAVDQIQQFTQTLTQNLNFSIDEDTGKTVIKIMDTQTQEVIRQIPSEEAINIARALGEIKGLLFSDEA
ncbi:MAG: flagellar protein FlaG [Nitrosomonas sp.]|jgi:flagellar protein FlaG|nr:flagellar protein FlaG [Nitrosomonas sp.]